jgi:hypothetical protein
MTPMDENVGGSDPKGGNGSKRSALKLSRTSRGFSDRARVIVQSVTTTAHFVSWEFANLGERLN